MGALTRTGNIFTDTSYPSGTPSKVIRCTDASISPSDTNNSFSAGLGGSGDAMQMFNVGDTLLRFNTASNGGRLVLFNPATLACGAVLTENLNLSSPGSSGTSHNFGNAGSFDWSNPTIFYQFPGNGISGTAGSTQTLEYSINPVNGQFCTNGTYSSCSSGTGNIINDFIYSLPWNSTNATNAPAWQADTSYSNGQYVTYTMQSSDSLRPFDWTTTTAYSLGDIIYPSVHNSAGCAFKVTAAGMTGSTEPNWDTAANSCQISHGQIGDGSVGWWPIGPPKFVFQLTSAGGMSGSSAPHFVPTSSGHPDIITTASDNGLTWTNVGVLVGPVWTDYAGVSYDGTRHCAAFSTDSYGHAGNNYSFHADQGTGIYQSCYSSATNTYYLLNTGTGIQSQATCSGGTGYNCSGGTWTMATQGRTLIATDNCGFFIHNDKGSYTMDYPVVVSQSGVPGASCSLTGDGWSWVPFQTFNSTTTAQKYRAALNHWTVGNTHLVDIGQDCLDNSIGGSGCSVGTYGYATGVFGSVYPVSSPYGIPLINWEPTCTNSWSPGNALPPCELALACDSHMSWAYNPSGSDTSPVCGTVYNYATLAPPPVAPWQGEFACISTSPTWTNPASPNASQQEWRFTHEFNTGGNSFFDVQFAISELSLDGKYAAFTSDWNCTLGTTGGGSTSLCGPPWVAGALYTVGQYVNPFSATGGSGTNYGVYEVTTGGTSASTHPAWFVCNSGTSGNTVTDSNGVVYTCQGPSNGRGDVFVVQLHT